MGDFELNILNSLPDVLVMLLKVTAIIALVLLGLVALGGVLRDLHSDLTRPMRRAERARLFLDILESTLKQGLPLEETLVSLAESRDLSLGVKFHLVCARLEMGLPLNEALPLVPDFLPARITAMLAAGKQLGNLLKVLPACRQTLKDALSQTQSALNYALLLTFLTAPVGFAVFWGFMIFLQPQFSTVTSFAGVPKNSGILDFFASHEPAIFGLQAATLLFTWLVVYTYIGGRPRLLGWFPALDWFHYLLPWRRYRMQRDFSTMLAVLLDSHVPEATALTLAADCSANSVFRRRAARAVQALQQGVKLAEAVQFLDDAGEFRWRLANAAVSAGGFAQALAGWHESLDARAFQQEQATAQGISTALVLWSGLFVGCFVAGVFMVLVSMVNALVLW